jgi:hypothetical protein
MSVLLPVVVILCLILWFIFWPSNKGLSVAERFQNLRRGGSSNDDGYDGYDDQDDDDHDDDHDGGGDNDD